MPQWFRRRNEEQKPPEPTIMIAQGMTREEATHFAAQLLSQLDDPNIKVIETQIDYTGLKRVEYLSGVTVYPGGRAMTPDGHTGSYA